MPGRIEPLRTDDGTCFLVVIWLTMIADRSGWDRTNKGTGEGFIERRPLRLGWPARRVWCLWSLLEDGFNTKESLLTHLQSRSDAETNTDEVER